MTGHDQTIVKKRSRILYVDGGTLYAQIGNELCASDDSGITWRTYPHKLVGGAFTYSRLHARLTRRGVHCLRVLQDGNLLLVANRSIFLYDHRKEQVLRSFSIPRGSRPLFICEYRDGDIFWGEYFGNAGRDAVNIYGSTDQGMSWQIAYTFQKNTIRHVHGVFHDPDDDRIWVTTGDENHEAGIWVTPDKFKTLERVVSGDQQTRALQLLFTPSYVYFGTDTTFEKNHIYRFNKSKRNVEKLFPVESSVFWGCKVDDSLFFSTAVEPSRVNETKTVSIWGSPDGNEWKRVASYQKDFWPSKYFQIGQIVFPQGKNDTGYLFYTPLATDKDQTINRIKVSELFG